MLPGIPAATPMPARPRAGPGLRLSMIVATSRSPASLIKRQHGPCDLARFHRAEGFVDVAEVAALGHHAVEVEAALAVEIEVERDVDAEPVGAHARGLHLAFRADRHPRELDRRVGR